MEQLLAILQLMEDIKILHILHSYFSEYALFKYRLKMEIEYFIELCDTIPALSKFSKHNFNVLRNIYINFTIADCQEIKKIECDTKHDIKAVEYFIQDRFRKLNMSKYNSFIHFGLTSQDINTSSLMLGIKESLTEVIVPEIINVKTILDNLSSMWKDITMLSRTHGQPATPTTVGKELQVFAYRLTNEIKNLEKTTFYTKFGGAVGNFSAHLAAYPDIKWNEFADI